MDQCSGHLEFVKQLLAAGAPIDARDVRSNTPLALACRGLNSEENAAVVRVLGRGRSWAGGGAVRAPRARTPGKR